MSVSICSDCTTSERLRGPSILAFLLLTHLTTVRHEDGLDAVAGQLSRHWPLMRLARLVQLLNVLAYRVRNRLMVLAHL